MVTPSTNIKLGTETALSASLYNTYHFLTQVAGLYAQIAEIEQRSAHGPILQEMSDRALSDLGELYSQWDEVQSHKNNTQDAALSALVSRTCARTERLIQLLNHWVPTLKWVKALMTCEHRYTRILKRVNELLDKIYISEKVETTREQRLTALRDSSLSRQARLSDIIAEIEKNNILMRDSFLAQEGNDF